MVTELFTSGNLRQFRKKHKDLETKTLKKFGRQILQGLKYLHTPDEFHDALVHGDIRCDKIYVNGNRGEIKIGDMGLALLQPFRAQTGKNPAADSNIKSRDNIHDP